MPEARRAAGRGTDAAGAMKDPYAIYRERPRVGLALTLFLLTVLTTMAAGAAFQGSDPFREPAAILTGWPYSLSLLFILGTHEFGHFFASKKHRVVSTLPYFIPAPPMPFVIGTFGAVIKMKSPITTKQALVDIGAAGPLVGFVSSIIVTIIGLRLSTVTAVPPQEPLTLGEPLAFKALSYLVLGPLPAEYSLNLHVVAFAGWLGFFVTSLNLLPIGQLDGGHIVYAAFGDMHRIVSRVMVGGLVIFGFLSWPGWIVWAVLVTVIGLWHPPVQNPLARLDLRRGVISAATLLVFVLTFMPSPFYIT